MIRNYVRKFEGFHSFEDIDDEDIEIAKRKPSEEKREQFIFDVECRNLDGVKHYINLDYDVNVSNEKGDSALFLACKNYDLRLIELLLKAEADPNKKNRFGNTPIYWCSSENKNSSKLLELLLNFGSEVNVKNIYGETPLYLCCEKENLENVHSLLNAGADVNEKDNIFFTPILEACRKNNLKLVKLLLEYGADVNVKNNRGETPLMIAKRNHNDDIVDLLLEYGAKE